MTMLACCLALFAVSTLNDMTMTGTVTQTATQAPMASEAIRPFRAQVPQAALDDLRRRIAATRWPDKETVPDQSQGAQLARLQALVQYWGSGYDWRKAELTLNALPQLDRKSTRLNSSHSQISYAVFCLKKKKKEKNNQL